MFLLRHRLRRAGYRVRQFHYRSMSRSLAENVCLLRDFIRSTPGEVLHVVGHSMGGILLRHAFERDPDSRPGRLVAIGSPLVDCWISRRVAGFHPRAYWLTGHTARDHILEAVDPTWRGHRELGVLAGTFPFGVGSFFAGLPKPNDGVICLSETRLGGIADHLTCGFNHFGMLLSRRCTDQIIHFLENGRFDRSDCSGGL
jgi:pimeloyl-ACP methyl ester carboxylesterase